MSSSRGLAKSYLRYWWKDSAGNWHLADNAPAALRGAIRTLPSTISTNMAYEAHAIVAGQAAQPRPLDMLLKWIAEYPRVTDYCDKILQGRQPPKTFAELVEKAYGAELLTARNHITSCLEREILT